MKILITFFFVFLFIVGLSLLLGAFYNGSFNFIVWNGKLDMTMLYILFGFPLTLGLTALVTDILKI